MHTSSPASRWSRPRSSPVVAASNQVAQNGTNNTSPSRVAELTLPSGTSIDVTLGTALTSETASVGSPWSGTTRSASVVDGRNVIPAGSPVAGTVTGVTAAHKGNRAMLDLGLTSVTVDGRSYRVNGTTEAVIAGSPRARNLGAIAAGTAAGALVGRAVSGSGKERSSERWWAARPRPVPCPRPRAGRSCSRQERHSRSRPIRPWPCASSGSDARWRTSPGNRTVGGSSPTSSSVSRSAAYGAAN